MWKKKRILLLYGTTFSLAILAIIILLQCNSSIRHTIMYVRVYNILQNAGQRRGGARATGTSHDLVAVVNVHVVKVTQS